MARHGTSTARQAPGGPDAPRPGQQQPWAAAREQGPQTWGWGAQGPLLTADGGRQQQELVAALLAPPPLQLVTTLGPATGQLCSPGFPCGLSVPPLPAHLPQALVAATAAAAAAAAAAAGQLPSAPMAPARVRGSGRGTGLASDSAVAAAALAARTVPSSGKAGKPPSEAGDASRRYRQRQRDMLHDLEEEVAAKIAELRLLTAENETLRLRAVVLEAAVASRETQMQAIQDHGPAVYDLASAPLPKGLLVAPAPGGAAGGPSRARGVDGNDPVAGSAGRGSGGVAAAQQQQQQQRQQLQPGLPNTPALLREARSPPSPEVIRGMTVEDIVQHWKAFVREYTAELVRVEHEGAAAAAAATRPQPPGGAGSAGGAGSRSIQALCDRCAYFMRTAAALNPAAYCRIYGRNLDTGAPATASDDHWRLAVSQVGLTSEQNERVLACAELYFSGISRLQEQRRALQRQLGESEPAKGLLIRSTGARPMTPLLDSVARCLKQEHDLRITLNSFFFNDLLTPIQNAKLAVASTPMFPDALSMVSVMCSDAAAADRAEGRQPRLVFAHRRPPGQAPLEGALALALPVL